MKILPIFILSLFCLTSCNSVDELNPLSAITENSGKDEAASTTTSQYMKLVNDYRRSIGLDSLVLEEDMSKLAYAHSQNMGKGTVSFGHIGFSDRCSDSRNIMGQGNLCGEIVAQGQSGPESVFASWMGSSGHRAKIQEARYTHTGFGYFKNDQGIMYWTQIFLEVD